MCELTHVHINSCRIYPASVNYILMHIHSGVYIQQKPHHRKYVADRLFKAFSALCQL